MTAEHGAPTARGARTTGRRPAFWPWVITAAVGYPVVWIGSSLILGALSGTGDVGYDKLLSSDATVTIMRVAVPQFLALVFTLIWGSRRVRLRDVYRQRMRPGPTWFWIPAALIPAGIVGFFVSSLISDSPGRGGAAVVASLVCSLVVGFAEESMYRGVLLVGSREQGYSEVASWAIATVAFGCLHLPNVVLGQSVVAAVAQFFVTATIGTSLYFLLRQTRLIPVTAVVHGLWDFGTGLSQGL